MSTEQVSMDVELCIVLSEREAHLFSKALSEISTLREQKTAGKVFFRLLRLRGGRFIVRDPVSR
jgi:hypothetical protein